MTSDQFLDRIGNQHILRKGSVAAEIIQRGGIPELLFEQCKEMHEHLEEMGMIGSAGRQAPRLAKQHLQYVVYHGDPDLEADPAVPRFRDLASWSPYSVTPYRQELPGWGIEPGSPLLDAPRSAFDPHLTAFLVTASVPLFDYEKAGGLTQEMDASALRMHLENWQYDSRLSKHVTAIDSATLKMDPIYTGMGDLVVGLRINAFNQAHAEHIVGEHSRPFFNELVIQTGAKPRSEMRVYVSAEIDVEQSPSATKRLRP